MKTSIIFLSIISICVLGITLLTPEKTTTPIQTEIKKPNVSLVEQYQDNSQNPEEKVQLVESYLDLSGMEKNFSTPGIILEKHLNSPILKAKFSQDEIERLTHFFESKLNAETIENLVKEEILKSFDVEELRELNRIYEIDLMKKLKSIEEYYSSDEALEKADSFFKNPENLKNSPARLTLLNQLIEAQEADFLAKTLTLESIRGLHHGLKKVLPKEKRVPDEKANLAINLLSRTPAANFRNTLLLRYQYSYRDLSDLELKNLIELSNNKLIRKVRQASMSGIKKAFLNI